MNGLPEMTPGLILLVGIVLVIEFSLLVWAVFDWIKRPRDQFRGNRFLWLALIVLFNVVGPIIYLAAGRSRETVDVPAAPSGEADLRSAADALYGSRPDEGEPR